MDIFVKKYQPDQWVEPEPEPEAAGRIVIRLGGSAKKSRMTDVERAEHQVNQLMREAQSQVDSDAKARKRARKLRRRLEEKTAKGGQANEESRKASEHSVCPTTPSASPSAENLLEDTDGLLRLPPLPPSPPFCTRGRSTQSAISRCSSRLPSAFAYVRASDDVVAF